MKKNSRTQGCYIPKLINTKNIYNDGKKKKILKRKNIRRRKKKKMVRKEKETVIDH